MKHKKLILITLLIILGNLIIIASYTSFYNEVYDNYKDMHITELKDKGVRHIERNEPDSAMACFLIVMSRYSDNMSVRDKQTCTKAFNNAGYVHTLMYSDYTTAYRYLLKALDIAKSIDFSQQYPLIYINIGNIYIFFEDFNNAASFYIKAYQTAKDVGDIPHMNHAINNLLLTMRAALSKEELLNIINSYFNSDLSNDSTSTFTRELCLITKDFLEGNTSVSDQLKRIDRLINNSTIDERNMENLKFFKYEMLLEDGQYRTVLNHLLDKIKRNDNTAGDMAVMYKGISTVYDMLNVKDSARNFEYKSLLIRDSLMHQQNYATIRDMHSSYELDKFEKNLTESENKRKNLLTLIIVGVIWILILSVVVTIIIKKNKRLNETLNALYNKNNPALDKPYLMTEDPLTNDNPDCGESGESSEDQSSHALDEETRKQIADEILKVMQDIKVIGQCEFTVRKLAEIIGIKERHVSNVINDYFNCNFNSLLNTYRIAEAKRILDDPTSGRQITIEGLANSLGFKSRSNFAYIFKKESGLTPKEYRKIAETRSEQAT